MLHVELPLKCTKPTDLTGAVQGYMGAQATSSSRLGAAALQQSRDRLGAITELTTTTADAAAAELLKYEAQVARLPRRLNDSGACLNVKLTWRDAWRPKNKVEKSDLEWERAVLLFNAAAAQSYMGARAQARGTAQNGLRDAVNHYKKAAGCLVQARELVKPAIWGLTPRWDPNSLSLDMRLDMLEALKDLMLAQAQRAFVQVAIAEKLSDGIVAGLATAAARLFGHALSALEGYKDHVCSEPGLFSAPDRSWMNKIIGSQELALAEAEEAAAREAVKTSYDYGTQVARLRKALKHAERAEAAVGSGNTEGRSVQQLVERLRSMTSEAIKANDTIYREEVVDEHALPPLEDKAPPKPLPPETYLDEPDPFVGLLPSSHRTALEAHHAAAQSKLTTLSSAASSDAAAASSALSALGLPLALEACEADKRLSARLVRALNEAKSLGGVGVLQEMLTSCAALEEEALSAVSIANSILGAEEEKDAQFLTDHPSLDLAQLKSSVKMQNCRSELQASRSNLRQAVEVTAGLSTRLDSARTDIATLEPPVEELEARLPHLDGTPLEAEPCVPALYELLSSVTAIKEEAAAEIAAGAALQEEQQTSGELGELLLGLLPESSPETFLEGKLLNALGPLEQSYAERQQRRRLLLEQIGTQHALFVAAQRDASSFAERKAYLAMLSNGAEEAVALHAGLKEGLEFYQKIITRLRSKGSDAASIAEEREAERSALIRAKQSRAAPPPPPPLPSAGNALQQARTAWSNSHPRPSAPPQAHPSPYPGAMPPAQPAVPTAVPYYAQRPVVQPTPYTHAHSQPAARPAPHAPAPPMPATMPARAQAPSQIMCHACRRKFGVPPGTAIVACPFCGAHNRVPS